MTTSRRIENQEEDKKIMPDYVPLNVNLFLSVTFSGVNVVTSVLLVGGDVRC